MNISLVYPSIKNAGWSSLGNTQESLWINHGVASLAACLQHDGHTVKLLDLRDITSWGHFESLVRLDSALTYGVSMATLDYHEALQAAHIIRKAKPNALIIVGGPHPSICPEQVAKHRVFDYIVKGEGEVTLPKLVASPYSYPRIVQGERANLDALPIEDREVFNLKKIFGASNPYSGKPFFSMPFLNVISGRGCVWKCGFCKPGEDMIFGKFRMRSLEHFFLEIEYLNKKYDFQTLMIDDDSFTLNPDYTLKFCDLYEQRVGKPFFCQSRADFIVKNPDVMQRLKQAGLDMVFIGFESGSQRTLDFMHKDTTVEQNFEAAEICHKLGIKIWANYMVGLPTETKEEMQATFDMIRKIKPEKPSGAFFTPIVGTELYDYCKQHGLMVSEDPAVLGSRNPSVPKIKGVDYKWLRKQMYPNSRLWKRAGKKMLLFARSLA
ncbi:MAG: radical SAM protein [Candidatus Paceibacterota bacterium]|jgi:anaerobic magnesium-protoporphyrin IX monomethyl ester cyclase